MSEFVVDSIESIAVLKDKGNQQFREKLFDESIESYSEAINGMTILVCFSSSLCQYFALVIYVIEFGPY